MRFNDTPELASWRSTVNSFVKDHWGSGQGDDFEGEMGGAEAQSEDRRQAHEARISKWLDRLGEKGWLAPAWPKKYGGHELKMLDRFVMTEEMLAAGAPCCAPLPFGLLEYRWD